MSKTLTDQLKELSKERQEKILNRLAYLLYKVLKNQEIIRKESQVNVKKDSKFIDNFLTGKGVGICCIFKIQFIRIKIFLN